MKTRPQSNSIPELIDRDLRQRWRRQFLARALQHQRDEELLATATARGDPILQGLSALSERNRLQRSMDIVKEK